MKIDFLRFLCDRKTCLLAKTLSLGILFLSSAVTAKTITLKEAIESAVANDQSYQSQLLSAQADELVLDSAWSVAKPRLDAVGAITKSNSDIDARDADTSSYSFNFTFTIFNKNTFVYLDQAELLQQIAQIDQFIALQNLVQEVVNQYVVVGVLYQQLKLTENQLKNSRSQYEKIALLTELGSANNLSLLQAQNSVNSLEVATLQARSDFDMALTNLSIKTGIEDISGVFFGHLDTSNLPPYVSNQDELVQAVENDNLAIKQLTLNQEYSYLAVDNKQAEFYPKLDLIASHTSVRSKNPHTDAYLICETTNSVGLQLTVPLYTGNSTSIGKKEMLLKAQSIDAQLSHTKRLMLAQTAQLNKQLATLKLQIERSKSAIQVAEENYRITNASFELGATNLLEVNTASNDLAQANYNLYQSMQQWVQSWLQFNINIGNLNEQSFENLNKYLSSEVEFIYD